MDSGASRHIQTEMSNFKRQLSNDAERSPQLRLRVHQAAQQYTAVVLSDQASISAIQAADQEPQERHRTRPRDSDIRCFGSGRSWYMRHDSRPPSVLRIPMFGVFGLVDGLLSGLSPAFAVGRKDRRLRRRDEIARAAGAPVLASLTKVRRPKSDDLFEFSTTSIRPFSIRPT